MGNATHEQVNLMLKLYDLRREPKLREARDWYFQNFFVKNAEDVMRIAPFGSQENTYMRMVMGYWDMVAGIANRGLLTKSSSSRAPANSGVLGRESSRRSERFGQCSAIRNFSVTSKSTAKRYETWREKTAPGSGEAMRKFQEQIQQQMSQKKAQAAAD